MGATGNSFRTRRKHVSPCPCTLERPTDFEAVGLGRPAGAPKCPRAMRAPRMDLRPAVVVRVAYPVGSLRPAIGAPVQGSIFDTAGRGNCANEVPPWTTSFSISPASTGERRSIACACSMGRAADSRSAGWNTAGAAWPRWSSGCDNTAATILPYWPRPSRSRAGPWWRLYWSTVLPCFPSTLNNWTVSATAIRRPEPRTIAAMRWCWPIRCAPTCIASVPCASMIRSSSACASYPGWTTSWARSRTAPSTACGNSSSASFPSFSSCRSTPMSPGCGPCLKSLPRRPAPASSPPPKWSVSYASIASAASTPTRC